MENTQDLSIDLTMFAISLNEISDVLDYNEFKQVMEYLTRAKYDGILDEYLYEVKNIYIKGTDLASAFDHAYFDLFLNPGENY